MRLCLALLCAIPLIAQKRPLDVSTMLKIARIGEPQLSPDGKQVAFTVTNVDVPSNTKPSKIYVIPVEGGAPKPLAQDGSQNERARWSPDSKQIYFVSNRGGSSQVWVMDA